MTERDQEHLYAVLYDTPHLPGAAVVRAASPEAAIELVRNAPDPNDSNLRLERSYLEARLLDESAGGLIFDFNWQE